MAHTNPILKNSGIHHVAISTADFSRSISFYRDVLGCKPTMLWGPAGERGVMLDVGDGNYVEVFERNNAAEQPAEARLLHLCLRCDNLDEVIEHVRQAGMAVTIEPKDVPIENNAEGGKPKITPRLAFFTGPDGEIIELMQCEDL
ncbi:MAG: VOC family protein [Planctomycetota bacterium]